MSGIAAHLGEVLTGPMGTAQEVIVDAVHRPAHAATVAAWFLTCPGQSIGWSNYVLAVVHLRPIEGHDAHIRFSGATHEVMIYALDPDRGPIADDPETWVCLTPANLAEQIEEVSDESAHALLRLCARAVVDGLLWAEPPLSGQVEPWRTALIRSSAHSRGEEHAP